MNGPSIVSEGCLRTVADTLWQVADAGDFDGDGRADILWRNSSTGENYRYPMDGIVIKPSEGARVQIGKCRLVYANEQSGLRDKQIKATMGFATS